MHPLAQIRQNLLIIRERHGVACINGVYQSGDSGTGLMIFVG
jgi:hypothetical protein